MTLELLTYAIVLGGSLLGLWLYVRFGAAAAPSARLVIVHLAVALALLEAAPHLIARLGGVSLSPGEVVAGLFAFFLPAITYCAAAALALFAFFQRALFGLR